MQPFLSSIKIEDIRLPIRKQPDKAWYTLCSKDSPTSQAVKNAGYVLVSKMANSISWDKEDDCPQVRNAMKKIFMQGLWELIIHSGYNSVIENSLHLFYDECERVNKIGFYGWVECM